MAHTIAGQRGEMVSAGVKTSAAAIFESAPDVSSVTSPPSLSAAPTVNAVSRDRIEILNNTNQYRRYTSRVWMNIVTDMTKTMDNRQITYKIGVRDLKSASVSQKVKSDVARIPQIWQLNAGLVAKLTGIVGNASRASYRPDFTYVDMSRPMQILGRAAMYYAMTGNLSCSMIRGDEHVNISTIRAVDAPVPSLGSVFIPRQMDPGTGELVFHVLAAAVNACGVPVVTDSIEVTSANAVTIDEPHGIDCFRAVWTAIRALMHMAAVSGAGPTLALALTTGIHSVATVQGHTDEGGIIRDILRNVQFDKPRGSVWTDGWREYAGVAALSSNPHLGEVQALLDGIALVTAAASARADPLVVENGKVFPSVFTARGIAPEGDGEKRKWYGQQQRGNLIAQGHIWAARYAQQLGKVLCTPGDHTAASEAIMYGIRCLTKDKRHIQHRVISPYYWIEPTSLFNDKLMDEPVDAAGYGVLCGRTGKTKMPFYTGTHIVNSTDTSDLMYIDWTASRLSGLMLAFSNGRSGVLEDIAIRQISTEQVVMEGVRSVKNLRSRVAGHERLDAYTWKHSSCMLPSPAEFLYTGGKIGVKVYKTEMDNEGDITRLTQFPCADWIQGPDCGIYMHASQPTSLSVTTSDVHVGNVNRHHSAAANLLSIHARYSKDMRRLSGGNDLMPINGDYTIQVVETIPKQFPDPPGGTAMTTGPSQPLTHKEMPVAARQVFGATKVTGAVTKKRHDPADTTAVGMGSFNPLTNPVTGKLPSQWVSGLPRSVTRGDVAPEDVIPVEPTAAEIKAISSYMREGRAAGAPSSSVAPGSIISALQSYATSSGNVINWSKASQRAKLWQGIGQQPAGVADASSLLPVETVEYLLATGDAAAYEADNTALAPAPAAEGDAQ